MASDRMSAREIEPADHISNGIWELCDQLPPTTMQLVTRILDLVGESVTLAIVRGDCPNWQVSHSPSPSPTRLTFSTLL